MRWILNRFFGAELERRTSAYLTGLAQARTQASGERASRLMKSLANASGPPLLMGYATRGEPVQIPVDEFLHSHAFVSGASGSGKTMFVLGKLDNLLRVPTGSCTPGFGILDPKQDLVNGALYLIGRRLGELERTEARDLRRRVVVLDFSSRDPISPYNILARWPGADPDFFAGSRTDLLLELLPGSDGVSLGASALLRQAILLLSEFNLPITWLDNLLHDEEFRTRLVNRSVNPQLARYFTQHFHSLPKQTIAALARRMEALFTSETLRLVLSGATAPDLRALQDAGKVVIVNCFGRDINRSVRHLLQALILSDLAHATFARRNHSIPFLWMVDEAQNLFLTQHLRDHMMDLLTMARSFGTHLMLMSQNMTTALQDARVLSVLHTNIRWAYAMRGEPADSSFLRAALPVTGRRRKPRINPFDEPGFYTVNEERGMVLEEIANLPDRTGYLWLKSRTQDALRITAPELLIPRGAELEVAIEPLHRDPTFGVRLSRRDYDRQIAAREREWLPVSATDPALSAALAGTYRRTRGGAA